MTNEQYEPTADSRAMAKTMYDMFQAMLQEGFTEEQALFLLGSNYAAAIQQYMRDHPDDK